MGRGECDGQWEVRGEGTKARLLRWEISAPHGNSPHILTKIASTTIKFTLEVDETIRKGHHGIARYDQDLVRVWASSTDNIQLSHGTHYLSHVFPMIPVRPGPYSWLVSFYEDSDELDSWEGVPGMVVATESHQHQDDRWNGILNVPSSFEVDGKAEID